MTTISIFVISIIIAVLFLWAIKIKAKNWVFLLLGVLPLILIYLSNPYNKIVSAHSFWQISIVYEIMNGHIPPKNPLLAGEFLPYQWFYHALVAGISYAFRVPPTIVFALGNGFALLLTIILVFKISKFLYEDRISNIFAVLLSIFGITFLIGGLIAKIVEKFLPYHATSNLNFYQVRHHGHPIFAKFAYINSTHFGVLFFALFLYSILHIFSKSDNVKPYYMTLAISVLGAGYFYPIHFLGVLACCFSCCLVMYLLHKKSILPKIIAILSCVFVGAVLVSPYLYQIRSAKGEAKSIMISSNFLHLLTYSFDYLLVASPILVVLFWRRKVLLNLLRTKTDFTLILMTVVVTTALMYIFIDFTAHLTQYKFQMLSFLALGIIASGCLQDIYSNKKRIICVLLVASFLFPFSSYMFYRLKPVVSGWKYDSRYVFEDGIYLRHKNPKEDAFYKWVRSQTQRDAVFIDSQLSTISFLGQRRLYVGLEDNPLWYAGQWGLINFLGHSPEIVNAREKVVDAIYSDADTKISEGILSELNRASSIGDVYIVARNAVTDNKFLDDKHFVKVFENKKAKVYKLAK
ncbi:MAG: hypothetical protein QNJ63_06380 [Calothrix sp. MO_192.B10]|nr:hypothetical protein [Calothrix sp. MO_192.B10]